MLLKKTMELAFSSIRVVEELLEQVRQMIGTFRVKADCDKSPKSAPILAPIIIFALVVDPLAECPSDTIETFVNNDHESDTLILGHCALVIFVHDAFNPVPSNRTGIPLMKHSLRHVNHKFDV